MNDFINEHYIIFGIIFSVITGYYSFKKGKNLIDEYLDNDWSSFIFTVSIFTGWFILLLGSIFLLIGYIKF